MEPLDPEYNGYAYNYSSSEDEDTPQKKCKELTYEEDEEEEVESSDDDFEKEMKNELDNAMSNYEKLYGSIVSNKSVLPADHSQPTPDSDEDEIIHGFKGNSNQQQNNDELLYDPNSDELDKQWVDQERFKYLPRVSNITKSAILPQSDAVLNCPGCMSLLCLDCQRHATYNNQYRAMFVKNCRVLYNEVKNCPLKGIQKKSRKRKSELMTEETGGNGDDFHPVHCNVCDTEVAAFDKDEVYHFFNVLSSH